MSLLDNTRDRCECGHMAKSHRGLHGLIGGGIILYTGCRHCDCKSFTIKEVYEGKKDGKLLYKPYVSLYRDKTKGVTENS